jgi:hypothetical protein
VLVSSYDSGVALAKRSQSIHHLFPFDNDTNIKNADYKAELNQQFRDTDTDTTSDEVSQPKALIRPTQLLKRLLSTLTQAGRARQRLGEHSTRRLKRDKALNDTNDSDLRNDESGLDLFLDYFVRSEENHTSSQYYNNPEVDSWDLENMYIAAMQGVCENRWKHLAYAQGRIVNAYVCVNDIANWLMLF